MKLPSAEQFYFKTSLYKEFEFDPKDIKGIYNLVYYYKKIDSFCPFCSKETTFKPINNYPADPTSEETHIFLKPYLSTFDKFSKHYNLEFFKKEDFEKKFRCSREDNHIIKFIIKIKSDKILKIGQYPTVADLSGHSIKNYEKILSSKVNNEFKKAVGLAAHGVGIGSFVYLRRIFENLIFDAFTNYSKENKKGISAQDFRNLRMDEKIKTIRAYLPNFLVEKRSIYSVLSKGIHELDEEKCNDLFPIMKLGIELILDEKLLEFEKQEKINSFSKTLEEIKDELK